MIRSSADCASAALAAVLREREGDLTLVPARRYARTAAAIPRQLGVLAHYIALGGEHAQLDDFLGSAGVEIAGRDTSTMPPDGATLPDAMSAARCTGTTCTSGDTRLELGYTRDVGHGLVLSKIRIVDRPGCR